MPKKVDKPSREKLHSLYYGEYRSLADIAALYDVTSRTVGNWMESYGIARRSRLRATKMYHAKKTYCC